MGVDVKAQVATMIRTSLGLLIALVSSAAYADVPYFFGLYKCDPKANRLVVSARLLWNEEGKAYPRQNSDLEVVYATDEIVYYINADEEGGPRELGIGQPYEEGDPAGSKPKQQRRIVNPIVKECKLGPATYTVSLGEGTYGMPRVEIFRGSVQVAITELGVCPHEPVQTSDKVEIVGPSESVWISRAKCKARIGY